VVDVNVSNRLLEQRASVEAAGEPSGESLWETRLTSLATDGFTRYKGEELRRRLGIAHFERKFQELRGAFDDLPADPYASETKRFRRYSRAVAVPWERSLRWLPTQRDGQRETSEYYQGSHNPEYPGARRRFASIPRHLQDSELLRELILDDLRQTTWHDDFDKHPIHVGVHFVKLVVAADGAEAIVSPNVLHQDGEPFTFAHLIVHRNVSGGVNFIAPPHCAGMRPDEAGQDVILDCFELEQPLDSYAVHDPLVSHYLSPIRRGGDAPYAERGVVLIDFTKFIPQI
jgi:hypothetical protein